MARDRLRQIVNVLALVVTLVFNGLASANGLNGQTTGEISDRFEVYFVPAGYVFSIWGLIYLGLLAFVVYQLLPSQGSNPRLRQIGYLFVVSCLANAVWLVFWHYELFGLSVVAMLVLLVSLITIYLRLGVGRTSVSRAERWCVRVPFSVYLGWVSVATIANITSALDVANWGGWGIAPATWAVIMLVVAGILAAAVSITRRDVAFLLVIVWASAGIAVKQAATPLVAGAAWALAAAAAAMVALAIVSRGRRA
ncbi:MAG: tryptophan-rich sensory protein [Anaerolineae bacterium]|nr:tryptophan-rich sensory protein [Anaerolineae bacterium]